MVVSSSLKNLEHISEPGSRGFLEEYCQWYFPFPSPPPSLFVPYLPATLYYLLLLSMLLACFWTHSHCPFLLEDCFFPPSLPPLTLPLYHLQPEHLPKLSWGPTFTRELCCFFPLDVNLWDLHTSYGTYLLLPGAIMSVLACRGSAYKLPQVGTVREYT